MDVFIVMGTFILAASLSRFTINPRLYSWVKWCLFSVSVLLILLILNIDAVAVFSNKIAYSISEFGIGYPRSWRLKTTEYDDVISGCYYVTYLSSVITMIYAATHEHKAMKEIRKRDSIINWSGFILFSWVVWIIFWDESSFTSASGPGARLISVLYNTQFGVVMNHFATVNIFSFFIGLCLRSTFSKK